MNDITFIAGGSKGLGAALVNSFKTKNHLVYEFSRTGNSSQHINCDFNQPTEAKQVFTTTFESHAISNHYSINLVINTAVLAPIGSILTANQNNLKSHLNINIESTLLLLQAFLSAFQINPCKKTISYITSGAARRAIPGMALYSASKAFFERFIDTLAEEQNTITHPFTCMTINPGVMNTSMQTEIRSQSADDFPMVEMWNNLYLKGQLADPTNVATVCTNLICESGVNGGYYTAQDLFKQQQ